MHSLCCHGGGLLLSAGRMVKVWQVADYSLVKVSDSGCGLRCRRCGM